MEHIVDMENYVRSRQRKGKTMEQVRGDLLEHGYDLYAATALVIMHWQVKQEDLVVFPDEVDQGVRTERQIRELNLLEVSLNVEGDGFLEVKKTEEL